MPPIYRERMNEKKNYTYHLIAIFTVGVWGLTFISTKVLIANGLSPKEIFLLRFLIAYIGIWFISPRKLFANNWKDELWLLLGGITGGSVYCELSVLAHVGVGVGDIRRAVCRPAGVTKADAAFDVGAAVDLITEHLQPADSLSHLQFLL